MTNSNTDDPGNRVSTNLLMFLRLLSLLPLVDLLDDDDDEDASRRVGLSCCGCCGSGIDVDDDVVSDLTLLRSLPAARIRPRNAVESPANEYPTTRCPSFHALRWNNGPQEDGTAVRAVPNPAPINANSAAATLTLTVGVSQRLSITLLIGDFLVSVCCTWSVVADKDNVVGYDLDNENNLFREHLLCTSNVVILLGT